MKTFILLLFTILIGIAAFLSAKLISQPYPVWIAGAGISVLFIFRAVNKAKKSALKKEQQRMFNEWFRNHGGFRNSY